METSTGQLLNELDERAIKALHSHSIYSPSAVGWLNQHDPNPELIGYAMWAMNAPPDTDFDEFGLPTYSGLDKSTKAKILAGEDFTTFLELSWRGIGLTLLYVEHQGHPISSQEDITWYHLVSCFVALTIASDRIRDLFLQAAYQVKLRQFSEKIISLQQFKKEKIRRFSFPFEYHLSEELDSGSRRMSTLRHRLVEHANIIEPLRTYRNNLVHKIASQQAVAVQELIRRSSSAIETIESIEPSSEILMNRSLSHDDEIWRRMSDIKTMYNSLIRIGSDVFELEYLLRNGIQK